MANIKNNASAKITCKLLLEAAGTVFAERGFHEATINEITDRAGASLASVNYHFRDKAELYAVVLRNIMSGCDGMLPPDEVLQGSPRQRLRAFVEHFLRRLLSREGKWWERVLVAREMAQKSPALESLVEHIIRPLSAKVETLAGEIAFPNNPDKRLPPKKAAFIASSILGQCLHYADHMPMIEVLYPGMKLENDIIAIADHITEFSIAGILSTVAAPPKSARSPKSKTRRHTLSTTR